ncbi:MAG TPA: glycosyltransferase, partial [Pirellulales bacterium]|nr:glycosyltransferase [Pirellulales bacterium]
GRHAGHFPAVVRRLSRLLRNQRAELVQSFLFHANLVARFAARRADVPHVLSGIRVAERSAHWHLWLDRLTTRLVDRYVCVSQAVADFSQSEARLPREKLVVVNNGIDAERFERAEPLDLTTIGLSGDRRLVTFVGRLDRQKGLLELLRHCPSWLERFPMHDLLLVGAGPLERELKQEVGRLAIGSRVHFTGWRDDVPRVLRASELFVLPSHWEGMPNALLEAMAAGLPVVAADVEGIGELLGADGERQVAPRGQPAAFCDRVIALLADRPLAEQLGAQNRRRAQQFTWQAMVSAYERLFEEVAGRVKSAIPPAT